MKRIVLLSMALGMLSLGACSKSKKLAKQHNDLMDTYVTLKQELPEAEVSMADEKVKVILPEAVLFALNSSVIVDEYLPVMKRIAGILNKYPKTNVLITGYTDITGTVTYNNALSIRRANSTKEELIRNKVKPGRIFTWGLGPKNPIADNKTEVGRRQNRRVEFVVLYDYKEGQQ